MLSVDLFAVPSKNKYLEWCVEYGFELVETDPEHYNDEEGTTSPVLFSRNARE